MSRALILLFAVLVLLAIASLSAQQSAPTPTATEQPAEDLSREELLDKIATETTIANLVGKLFFAKVLTYLRSGGHPSWEYPWDTLTREELLELLVRETARANEAKARADAGRILADALDAEITEELNYLVQLATIIEDLKGDRPSDSPLPSVPLGFPVRPTPAPSPGTTLTPTPSPIAPLLSWDHLTREELFALLTKKAVRGEAETARADAESARAYENTDILNWVNVYIFAFEARIKELQGEDYPELDFYSRNEEPTTEP